MNHIHSLALAGFEPTNEEYSQAVLADLVAQRAAESSDRADTSQPEAGSGRGQAETSRTSSRSPGH